MHVTGGARGGCDGAVPLTLIRGSYQVVGASPDGDSVRFAPQDPGAWAAAGIRARGNAAGGAQLRLDAIDALETHYTPPGGTRWQQPAALAGAAADRLLSVLGFTGVVRAADGTVTSAVPDRRPGFVLTRFADKYGRPVALAYPDDAGKAGGPGAGAPSGSPVWLDVDGLRGSVNYQLLEQGWAYPTFYSRLYVDLRAALAGQAVAARAARLGVWAQDATTADTVTSREQVQQELVVLPKLFRRLADYLSLQPPGDVDLAGLKASLAARNDRLFTVPDGQATSLDTLVSVTGQQVALTVPPERLVFLES